MGAQKAAVSARKTTAFILSQHLFEKAGASTAGADAAACAELRGAGAGSGVPALPAEGTNPLPSHPPAKALTGQRWRLPALWRQAPPAARGRGGRGAMSP